MKTTKYQLSDISNILAIPKTTVRDRLRIMKIKPFEVNRLGRVTKHYYSDRQLQALKLWFAVNGHKKQPKPIEKPKQWFDIETNCMVVESKINYL